MDKKRISALAEAIHRSFVGKKIPDEKILELLEMIAPSAMRGVNDALHIFTLTEENANTLAAADADTLAQHIKNGDLTEDAQATLDLHRRQREASCQACYFIYTLAMIELENALRKSANEFKLPSSKLISDYSRYFTKSKFLKPKWVNETLTNNQNLSHHFPTLSDPEKKLLYQTLQAQPENTLLKAISLLLNRYPKVTEKNWETVTALLSLLVRNEQTAPNVIAHPHLSLMFLIQFHDAHVDNDVIKIMPIQLQGIYRQVTEFSRSFVQTLAFRLATNPSPLSDNEKFLLQIMTEADPELEFMTSLTARAIDDQAKRRPNVISPTDLYTNLTELAKADSLESFIHTLSDDVLNTIYNPKNILQLNADAWEKAVNPDYEHWTDQVLEWVTVWVNLQDIKRLEKKATSHFLITNLNYELDPLGFNCKLLYAEFFLDWHQHTCTGRLYLTPDYWSTQGDFMPAVWLDFGGEFDQGGIDFTFDVVDPEALSGSTEFALARLFNLAVSEKVQSLHTNETMPTERILETPPEQLAPPLTEKTAQRYYPSRKRRAKKELTDTETTPTDSESKRQLLKQIVGVKKIRPQLEKQYHENVIEAMLAEIAEYNHFAKQGHHTHDAKMITLSQYLRKYQAPGRGKVWQIDINVLGVTYRALAEVNPNDESQAFLYAIVPRANIN